VILKCNRYFSIGDGTSEQRTIALQAELAEQSNVALVAVVHWFALKSFYSLYSYQTPSTLWIEKTPRLDLRGTEESKAALALADKLAKWKQKLPENPKNLWAWLLDQPQADLLALLAVAVAPHLNGHSRTNATEPAVQISWLSPKDGYDHCEGLKTPSHGCLWPIPRLSVLYFPFRVWTPKRLQKDPLS